MKLSVISPVKNEADWIGYSIMAVLPYVHDIVYTCAKSTDGTDELLDHIKAQYAGDKLKILRKPEYDFSTKDTPAYNRSYNDAVVASGGDAIFFLHPDMICTNPDAIPLMKPGPLAWWTNLTSIAGNFDTVITKGRATKWKNIHANKFSLQYFGAYGSQNEDFYFQDITGKAHVHYGERFKLYPFKVADSGLNVLHMCECKPYSRRLEKMKSCLRNLYPLWDENQINTIAVNHPRVTLEGSGADVMGLFEFSKISTPVPDVITKYKAEFDKVLGR